MNKIKQIAEYSQSFGSKLAILKILAKMSSVFGRQYVAAIDKYLYDKFTGTVSYENKPFNKVIDSKSPIWVMWWQGEDNAPRTVRMVLQSIRNYAEDHPVILVTKDNYRDYTETAHLFYQYVLSGQITLTHFSDYMRFELLYLHGGFWFDATLLMNNNIPSWVYEHRFFSIKQGNAVPTEVGKWDPRWSKKWTAYCWGGCSGDPLFKYIIDFLNVYHQQEQVMIDYLLIDRIIQFAYTYNEDVKKAIDSIPISNTDCLSLRSMLNSAIRDFELKEDTFLFKLTWKEKFTLYDKNNNQTVYGSLLDRYEVS